MSSESERMLVNGGKRELLHTTHEPLQAYYEP